MGVSPGCSVVVAGSKVVDVSNECFYCPDIGGGTEETGCSALVGGEDRAGVAADWIDDWGAIERGAGVSRPAIVGEGREHGVTGEVVGIEGAEPGGVCIVTHEVDA